MEDWQKKLIKESHAMVRGLSKKEAKLYAFYSLMFIQKLKCTVPEEVIIGVFLPELQDSVREFLKITKKIDKELFDKAKDFIPPEVMAQAEMFAQYSQMMQGMADCTEEEIEEKVNNALKNFVKSLKDSPPTQLPKQNWRNQ